MKVAMKGFLYNANDVANGRVLCYEFERQGITAVKVQDNYDMSFRILVPDNVELTTDVYP